MDDGDRGIYTKKPYRTFSTAPVEARAEIAAGHPAYGACRGGSVVVRRYTVAVLWRGDQEQRRAATPYNNRYRRVFEELTALGIDAQPAVYADDIAALVREQLLKADGVLVWVDPIHEGRTRVVLDEMLRDVATRGPWVSAHPDVILKIGVKEVLHRTKHLGWGTDTHLYRSMADFLRAFPRRLRTRGPRVLKQNRGNGGQGVWKVELIDKGPAKASLVCVLHAQRGSMPEQLPLDEFMARCRPYFESGGCIIDQPFQPRLPEGMIRCYMGVGRVVGFGHQLIKALMLPPPEGPDAPAAQPGPRIMHAADAAPFQELRGQMEAEWTPQMMADARDRPGVSSHHLGRRFSLWTTHHIGRGQLRLVRDQCQLSVCDSRSSTRCHRAADIGEAGSECRRVRGSRAASTQPDSKGQVRKQGPAPRVVNLMDALKASVDAEKKKRRHPAFGLVGLLKRKQAKSESPCIQGARSHDAYRVCTVQRSRVPSPSPADLLA